MVTNPIPKLATRLWGISRRPSPVDAEVVAAVIDAVSLKPWPGATELVLGALDGTYGPKVADLTWRRLQQGIPLKQADGSPLLAPFGMVCLFTGALTMLRAITLNGPPPAVAEAGLARTPAAWLDLLCTTAREYGYPDDNGYRNSLVALVAAAAGGCEHCDKALGLAWDVAPGHPDFADVAAQATPGGAMVKAFLAHKGAAPELATH